MARIPINNLDDPRIAIYRSLKATNVTRQLSQFVVEGERLVERVLLSRFLVVSVLVTDRYESKLGLSIADAIPTYVVPHAVVNAIVGFPFHRGMLACAERRSWPSLEEIADGPDRPLFLAICPKLSNPENLGALRGSATSSGSTRSSWDRSVPTRSQGACSGSRWGLYCDSR